MRLETIRELARSPRLAYGVLRYGRLPSPRYVNLKRAVKELQPQRIVEIGTYHGDGAVVMLRRARWHHSQIDYWGFDLFEEATPETLAHEAASPTPPSPMEEVRRRLEGLGATVHLNRGDTTVTLPRTDVPPADLVFIDGGHSYETVSSDWENVQRFLHPGSVIYFDDYTNQFGVREGYGITRLVDELDPAKWRVELLKPVDRFRRPQGVLKTRFARVQAASPPPS